MRTLTLILIFFITGGCTTKDQSAVHPPKTMTIQSTAFQNDAPIPQKFTCQGEDISPALAWTGAPDATKSFALVCEDPTRRAAHTSIG